MQSKKIIMTADDLGNSKEINYGILEGIRMGVLSSTCIMPNGPDFNHATNEIIPEISCSGIGIHLDIIENKSLLNKNSKSLLCDSTGRYKCSYPELIKKSFETNFLTEVEAEFRSQIEAVLSNINADHLNSHVHTHAIPAIFELTCKLAIEYKIPAIRTQYEKNYIVPSKSLNFSYGLNLVKAGLLNAFSVMNKKTAKNYNINTNSSFVGVRYTGMMSKETILEGIKAADSKSVEVLVHPYLYKTPGKKDMNRYNEYKLLLDEKLRSEIENMGYKFSRFIDLD